MADCLAHTQRMATGFCIPDRYKLVDAKTRTEFFGQKHRQQASF